MTELRITRGGDIRLFADGQELFGVMDLKAVSKNESREIREFLASSPIAVMKGKEKHEIHLSVLSLFSSDAFESGPFTLSAEDGGVSYDYEGCVVISRERGVSAGKNVVDKFIISAKSMKKRVVEDAG